MIRPVSFVCAGLLLAACQSARPEASALVAGVERFHLASNFDRPDRADALAHLECQDAQVCAARAVCVEATGATAQALVRKRRAEVVLDEVEAGKRPHDDPAVKALAVELDEASQLLKKGHDLMPRCDQQVLVLRGRYGL
jgi:hypothetical protein